MRLALSFVAVCVLAAGCADDALRSPTGGAVGAGATSVGAVSSSTSGAGGSSGTGGVGAGGQGQGGGLPRVSLGANVDATGVLFRVWAPHATSAWVEGDFAQAKVAMMRGADDVFEAEVDGAKAGARYHYLFDGPAGMIGRLDPYCRQIDQDRCVVVDPSAYAWQSNAFQRPARNATIVYEMHVGSFAVDAQGQGTFDAARQKLGELKDLGVNAVELMPVQAFGGKPNGWGYNPQLFLAPKPSYGTPEALRGFVDASHGLGMGVWIDTVVNHCDGWKQAPLHCYDGDCGGAAGVYFFDPGPYASTPWGPRPDYTRKQVAGMLLDATDAWLTEYRGDGFRWDSVSNIRALDGQGSVPGGSELLVEANARTHQVGAMSVAEDLKGFDGITKAAKDGGLGFDAQWDGFGYTVMQQLSGAADDARDMGAIQGALQGSYAGDPFARLLFVEDHDTVGNGGARLTARIDPAMPQSWAARRRAMLGGAILLTAPGVPMIFMGQESANVDGFLDPPAPLAAPTAAGAKVRAFYKDLIALRKNVKGGTGGLLDASVEVMHKNDAAKVVGYRRHGPSGEDVIVVLNFRNKAYTQYDVGVPDAGPWKVRLNSESTAYGDDFKDGQTGMIVATPAQKDGKPFALPLVLAPYAAMVLSH